MSTSTSVLAGDLGPRGRRQAFIASAVGAVVALGLLALAVGRLADKGQFDEALWDPFTNWEVVKFLLVGLRNTLQAAAIAMVLALVVGGFMALGRLARNAPVRWAAGVYVELFRALPLLLLILFSFLVPPQYGWDISPMWALVAGLTLYNSAMLAEVFRAGVLSLDRGQGEAATSLGMRYWQSMRIVIFPQAARRMVPAVISQLVALLKDTSLGFVITFEELLRRAEITGTYYNDALQALVVVSLVYLVVNFVLSRLARRLEVRGQHRYRARPVATGVEDLDNVEAIARAADR